MKKDDFLSRIDEIDRNRPYRIVTYVSGSGLLETRRKVRRDLPAELLQKYADFIMRYFHGFEREVKKDDVEDSVLFSLSEPQPKAEFDASKALLQEALPEEYSRDIEKVIEDARKKETFSDMLIRLQNRKGMKAPDLYHKAGIDLRHFSKIISDRDYKPKKETVFALALALELDEDQSRSFLESAGYSFSPSSLQDMTIKYFIRNRNYDRIVIDMLMESLDLPLLPQNW